MKISIISPVYKTEKFLKQCIESVLNQTYSDFELIMVSDASPDNSEAIIKAFQKKDVDKISNEIWDNYKQIKNKYRLKRIINRILN